MAASVSATYGSTLYADETVAHGLDNADDKPIRHELAQHQGVLNASSTPAATKAFSDDLTLVANAAAIDLTSLAGPLGAGTVDFSGLKVQLVKVSCPTSNAGSVAISAKDGTTGYGLFTPTNSGGLGIILSPGTSAMLYWNDKLEVVDATHKDVKLSGTTNDVMSVLLVAG